jgi:hypothetical protein
VAVHRCHCAANTPSSRVKTIYIVIVRQHGKTFHQPAPNSSASISPTIRWPRDGRSWKGPRKRQGVQKTQVSKQAALKSSTAASIQPLQTLRCCTSDTFNRKVLRDNIQAVTKGDIKYVIFNFAINQIQRRGCATASTHPASGLVSLPWVKILSLPLSVDQILLS